MDAWTCWACARTYAPYDELDEDGEYLDTGGMPALLVAVEVPGHPMGAAICESCAAGRHPEDLQETVSDLAEGRPDATPEQVRRIIDKFAPRGTATAAPPYG